MAKFKFEGDWKALLFAHCEKIVAGVILLVALMLVWSAMGKDGLPTGQLPDDIDTYTSLASNKISSAEWEQFLDKPEAEDLTQGSVMTQISPRIYRPEKRLRHPHRKYRIHRKDPSLYPVEELHAEAGFGMLAMRGPKARPVRNREILVPRDRPGEVKVKRLELNGVGVAEHDVYRGARWVVVTGLVPTGEQEDEYLRVFKDAKAFDPKSDYPMYWAYYVQRAEVTKDDELNWGPEQLISPRVIKTVSGKWSTQAPPLVKNTFLHSRLTYPLPPMLIRGWDSSAVHPKVSLDGSEGPMEAVEPEIVEQEPEDGPAGGNLADDVRIGFSEEEEAKRRRRLLLEAENGGGQDEEEEKREIAALKMFRYFDFDVEPGKKYRYRVKLVMRDVNYERLFPLVGKEDEGNARVEKRFLDPSVVERIQNQEASKAGLVFTEWSEPSKVVTVPSEERFFAGPVEQSIRSDVEPTTSILIKKFDIVTGDDVVATMKLSLASMVNTETLSLAIDPKERIVLAKEGYSIETDAILVDILGGERMAGNREKNRAMTQPGELLFMTPSGRLMVRSEASAQQEFEEYRAMESTRSSVSPGSGGNPLLGGGDSSSDSTGGLID